MRNPKNNCVQLPFNDDAFIQKWQEWLQYRKERRLPNYVPTGLKKTFTNLLNISNNSPDVAIQIIDQSLNNNWQGLFPLKNIDNGTANQRNFKEKHQPAGTIATGGFGQL